MESKKVSVKSKKKKKEGESDSDNFWGKIGDFVRDAVDCCME